MAGSSPPSIRRGRDLDISALYTAHHQELYRYCRSILRHDEDAMDALQATFAKAVASMAEERREIDPRPWLFRVAHNESIGILRRRRAEEDIEDTTVVARQSTADDAMQRADLHQLQEDLADLTERQRQALVLRELSGLGHEEISAVLDTTPRAVKQIIYEARAAMHECREGRTMACDEIRRQLSDADGRVTRSRRTRAHLRDCVSCRAFQKDLTERPERLAAIAPAIPALAGASLLQDLLAHGADVAAGETIAGGASAAAGTAGVAAGTGALGSGAAGGALGATAVTTAGGSAGLLSGVAAKVAVVAALAGGGAGGAVLATDIGDGPPTRTAPSITAAPAGVPPTTAAPFAASPASGASPGASGATPAAERRAEGQRTAAERRAQAAERRAAARRRAALAREKAATARERGQRRKSGASSDRRPATGAPGSKARPAPAARKPAVPSPRRGAAAPSRPAPQRSAPAAPKKAAESLPSPPPAKGAPPKVEPSAPGGKGRAAPEATAPAGATGADLPDE